MNLDDSKLKFMKFFGLMLAYFFCVALVVHAQDINGIQLNSNEDNLKSLNMISVTIGGDFVVNGTFPASRTETVDQFVTRIITDYQSEALRTTKEKEIIDIIKSKLGKFAKRNILLKRYDGSSINVDLAKFRLTGDFSYNPYLQKNDVIIFPVLNLEKNFIDISGAVNKPTVFQFVEGDKLSDAILFANGLNPAYKNVKYAVINKLSSDGKTQTSKKVLISDNPLLHRGDRIKIIADENKKENYKVLVLGEVKQPGYVYITKNRSDIRDVIKSAGGFTEFASLRQSSVLRGTNKENLLKIKALKKLYESDKEINLTDFENKFNLSNLEYLSMLRMSDAVLEDSVYFLIDMKLREFFGDGVVDFTKIFGQNDSAKTHFYVKDGDVILVPEKSNTVYVFGQVNAPGYVPYKQNANYEYYVNKAGGYGEDYRDDIKVIEGKTKNWISADESTKIYPGDFVYVPKSPSRSFFYYLRTASFITSIASALATVAILIINLSK